MAREDAALERGQHRVVEADEPGEQLPTGGERGEQVVAELLLDGAVGEAGRAQGAEGHREVGHDDQRRPVADKVGCGDHGSRVSSRCAAPCRRRRAPSRASGGVRPSWFSWWGSAPWPSSSCTIGPSPRVRKVAYHRGVLPSTSSASTSAPFDSSSSADGHGASLRRVVQRRLTVVVDGRDVGARRVHELLRPVEVAEQRCVVQRHATRHVRRRPVLHQRHRSRIGRSRVVTEPLTSLRTCRIALVASPPWEAAPTRSPG